jgi:hypothetical protein
VVGCVVGRVVGCLLGCTVLEKGGIKLGWGGGENEAVQCIRHLNPVRFAGSHKPGALVATSAALLADDLVVSSARWRGG